MTEVFQETLRIKTSLLSIQQHLSSLSVTSSPTYRVTSHSACHQPWHCRLLLLTNKPWASGCDNEPMPGADVAPAGMAALSRGQVYPSNRYSWVPGALGPGPGAAGRKPAAQRRGRSRKVTASHAGAFFGENQNWGTLPRPHLSERRT